MIDLTEKVDDRPGYGVPAGPFFNDANGVFGESVGDIAARWLGDPTLAEQATLTHRYRVVLVDNRAHISEFRAQENKLDVIVDALPELSLRCVVIRTGFRGERETLVDPVVDGRAHFAFTGSVKRLQVWLLTADGQLMDEYSEDEHRVSWGFSIYNQPRTTHDSAYRSLHDAVQQGESEVVEFKEWLKAEKRDNKTLELLKTACAFANTGGGDLYIGVGDHAEIVGVSKRLQATYGPKAKARLKEQQDAYVGDLRRLLNEGVRPATQPEFQWVESAGLVVLRIKFPKGAEDPYCLVESGDIYVRAGATSRKARQADLSAFQRHRSPSVPIE